MRIIDLTATITPSPEDTELFKIEMTYNDHATGATQMKDWLGVPANLLRNGEGAATEVFTRFGTHDATHIDAPWHYNSEIQGAKAKTIDELPLEWFFNDGVVLDMTHKKDFDPVTVEDIEKELGRIGYHLKPMDIVLVRTGRDVFYNDPDYPSKGCGVSADATRWLYEKGIKLMGIDAWGWDKPLQIEAQEALEKKGQGIFFTAHQVNLPYSHIERMVNLGALPPFGFKVSCFPLKIKNASGAPARVVAILED
jgi:kynurenine formamidase